MKRIVTLLIPMLALASLFSARIEHEALPSSGLSEKLSIVLDLSASSPLVIPGVEIGFSSNEINEMDDEVEIINGQHFDLTFEETATHASVSDDIYVYWKLKGNTKVNAYLQIDSPLENRRGDIIDWSAGVEDEEYRVGMDTYYNGSLAFIPQEQLRASASAVGSKKLEIKTEELNTGDVIPGEYIGELKLNIAIN